MQTMVWGGFCLVALGAAVARPRITRRLLGGFFVLMALGVNVVYVILDPAGFVHIGTDQPLLGLYSWGFATVVAAAPVAFGLALAAYEVAVGVTMMLGGRAVRWGLAGGILFLVVSAPLNPWTPPNLILAAALLAIVVREPAPVPALAPATLEVGRAA